MEPFSAIAGVVGFIASVDSIINLCNRLLELDFSGVQMEKARVLAIRRVYEKLKTLETHVTGEDKEIMIVCNECIYPSLCKVAQKLSKSKSPSFIWKKAVKERLDAIEKVLNIVSKVLQLIDIPVLEEGTNSTSNELPSLLPQSVLQRILDPKNKRFATRQELMKEGVYSNQQSQTIQGTDRFVKLDDKIYIVETIPVGSSPRETAARISRLGRLILLFRNLDTDLCLAKMVKIIEQDGKLHVLSEAQSSITLENKLSCLREKRKVLISLAAAIEGLHQSMIVHESISCNNILIEDNEDLKLTGFLFARMADPQELSERERSSSDPLFEKRRKIYQAPERIAGGRYSFECDIYSLGVVMAEIHLGRSFVLCRNGPEIQNKDDILNLLQLSNDSLSACIRECLSTEACHRPSAWEVLYRLEKMDFKTLHSPLNQPIFHSQMQHFPPSFVGFNIYLCGLVTSFIILALAGIFTTPDFFSFYSALRRH